MKKHSFMFFIKQKKREMEQLLTTIHSLNQEIEDIQGRIEQQKSKLEELQQISPTTIFCLQNREGLQQEITKSIKALQSQAAHLKNQLEKTKRIVHQLHSEKSALEKMLKKQEAWQRYKQIQQENEIANESFIREHYINK